AAPVQCDVDSIPKGSHYMLLQRATVLLPPVDGGLWNAKRPLATVDKEPLNSIVVTATRQRSSASSASLTARRPDRGPCVRPRPQPPVAPPGRADPAAPGPTLGPSKGARFSSCRPRT